MSHSLPDRTAIVASIPLFAGLRKRDLTRLARSADEDEYASGQQIIVEGAAGDACYVLTDGSATVYRNGKKVTDLGPGAVFGEMALLDGGARSATVEMKTHGSVLRVSKRAFDEALDTSPAVGRAILCQVADRLRQADDALYS